MTVEEQILAEFKALEKQGEEEAKKIVKNAINQEAFEKWKEIAPKFKEATKQLKKEKVFEEIEVDLDLFS